MTHKLTLRLTQADRERIQRIAETIKSTRHNPFVTRADCVRYALECVAMAAPRPEVE